MDADVAIELAKLRTDMAIVAAEVVRQREALGMTNQATMNMLESINIVKRQVDKLQSTLSMVESWVGVPEA